MRNNPSRKMPIPTLSLTRCLSAGPKRLARFMAVIMILVLASCASHKRSADILQQPNIVAQGSLTLKAPGKNLTAPAKLSINQGQIVRLQVMMPILGSELARAEFTPQSVLIIDRMNKQYFSENYSTINRLAGVSLSYPTVQMLVLDYLAKQDEMRIELPTSEKPVTISLKGEFDNIKATDETISPSEVSTKYKRMQIKDLAKLLNQ